ncbi:hypothetical protein N665_0120s0037 [Sinapis alba]|nr:hypothetical protein N665_0120s0037 [Sinapis alba]
MDIYSPTFFISTTISVISNQSLISQIKKRTPCEGIVAAKQTGRKMKVYAVEKNPGAVGNAPFADANANANTCDNQTNNTNYHATCVFGVLLRKLIHCELLGSFGDNELSPECLDGAQSFLKPDGISIPSLYTSFIQPVTASKLYNDIKAHKDLADFETAYVVKLHSVAKLAPSQSVFTFTHPNFSTKANNQRYKKLAQPWCMTETNFTVIIHNSTKTVFTGYFDSVLYKDVHLGIEPTTATPNMFSWFPIFFPLRKPVEVHPDSPLEVHFWRCCGSSKTLSLLCTIIVVHEKE